MDQLLQFSYTQLTIEPWRIPVVMLSGVIIYLVFIVLVRIFGTRVLAKMTTFDAVVIVMFGAVAGRVIVGHPPTLAAGVIGLITLMLLEAFFGVARSIRGVQTAIDGRPHVVVAHGEIIPVQLRFTHISQSDVKHAIRRAGISSLSQVQLMILEPTGEMSIFRNGDPIDEDLLSGVAGIHHYFEHVEEPNSRRRDKIVGAVVGVVRPKNWARATKIVRRRLGSTTTPSAHLDSIVAPAEPNTEAAAEVDSREAVEENTTSEK